MRFSHELFVLTVQDECEAAPLVVRHRIVDLQKSLTDVVFVIIMVCAAMLHNLHTAQVGLFVKISMMNKMLLCDREVVQQLSKLKCMLQRARNGPSLGLLSA